jgi:hypothetical protein
MPRSVGPATQSQSFASHVIQAGNDFNKSLNRSKFRQSSAPQSTTAPRSIADSLFNTKNLGLGLAAAVLAYVADKELRPNGPNGSTWISRRVRLHGQKADNAKKLTEMAIQNMKV